MKKNIGIGYDNFRNVIEIKVADSKQSIKSSLNEAAKQIQNNRYDAELQAHGITDIFRLCLAVKGKK